MLTERDIWETEHKKYLNWSSETEINFKEESFALIISTDEPSIIISPENEMRPIREILPCRSLEYDFYDTFEVKDTNKSKTVGWLHDLKVLENYKNYGNVLKGIVTLDTHEGRQIMALIKDGLKPYLRMSYILFPEFTHCLNFMEKKVIHIPEYLEGDIFNGWENKEFLNNHSDKIPLYVRNKWELKKLAIDFLPPLIKDNSN